MAFIPFIEYQDRANVAFIRDLTKGIWSKVVINLVFSEIECNFAY